MPIAPICPVCQRQTAKLHRHPDLVPDAVALLRRIQPTWTEADGCCSRSFNAVAKTIADADGQAERLDAQTGINGYYRRVLTGRESRLWHH
jgi:hypothetical protein